MRKCQETPVRHGVYKKDMQQSRRCLQTLLRWMLAPRVLLFEQADFAGFPPGKSFQSVQLQGIFAAAHGESLGPETAIVLY